MHFSSKVTLLVQNDSNICERWAVNNAFKIVTAQHTAVYFKYRYTILIEVSFW